jgi:succinyl-CoA synthetase beta subunit
MLGNRLVTKQSGADGLPCNAIYIVEKIGIDRELYLSLTLDRAAASPTFIYSTEGGMSIEDVAHDRPDAIHKLRVNPLKGLDVADLKQAAKNLRLEQYEDQVVNLFQRLYACFWENDCDMIEINPLVLTKKGEVMCADSKVTIDNNALFRQKALAAEEDKSQDNPKEAQAKKYDLNYIHIGGNIGCLVNGAGLAMSTMDIINQYGGRAANFLDVGGSAEGEALTEALKLLNNDVEVRAIFINIFGGILRCDRLAESVIKANELNKFTKPIVLRLKGTNSDKAKELIAGKEKELGIYYNEDFDSAAQQVCRVA